MIKCTICKKEIKDRERIVVNYRFLGSMKVLENLHKICWEKLVDIYCAHWCNCENCTPED